MYKIIAFTNFYNMTVNSEFNDNDQMDLVEKERCD